MSSNQTMPEGVAGNPIYAYLWNRLYYNNQNFLGAYCGQTGSGKSYAALYSAWIMDRAQNGGHRFSIDNVVFTPEEFLKAVKNNSYRGTFIIWDEVGVGINSRTFYEKTNLMISYVTQTFRWKNFGVLYTVPAFGYIDKQVRQLFHAYVQMLKPLPHLERSVGKWYWLNYNPRDSQDLYFPLPRVIDGDGGKRIIDKVYFPLPPKELINQYEEKKKAIVESWYAKYQAAFDAMEEKELQGKEINEIVQEIKDNGIEAYKNPKNGRIIVAKIAADFRLGMTKAYRISQLLKG